MKKLIQLSFIAVLFFAVNSCKKNDANNNNVIVPYETGKTITTVVAGKVTDQTGTALNNVQITIGSTTITTDVNGSFIIPKASLGEKIGFIKATKDGYFAGSRTIMPKEKVINNIVIQLVKKTQSGTFTNASGGTITVATGGSIVFPVNAVVTKSGASYTGAVKVSAYFLDPTSKDCYKEMPGDLRGINTSNNEQVLTSYGMMAVELNGSNGEALQLATGKTATLTFPVVAATQSKAPATIPLWFFDETKGMWVEQGTATKVGNNYVGTVSHFTWWNCDWGGGPITLTATFVDQNGNPLNNYHVWMLPANNSWGGGHGYTASDGSLTGNIPANENIIIKVESNSYCGSTYTTLYTSTVGPFTQNTNLGNIVISLALPTTIIIKGTVVDCINNPVINGYAVIHFNNNVYYAHIANSLFNLSNTYCTSVPIGTATVDVFDLTTLIQNTTSATVNVTGAGTFNVGQIAACGVQNFVHYTATFVDQNGNALTSFYVSFTGDSTTTTDSQTSTINAIVQANKVLIRKIYVKPICYGYYPVLVDSTQIDPFTSDFNAGVIAVNMPPSNNISFIGTIKDCNNNPVSGNAYITIPSPNGNNNYTLQIVNGQITGTITNCSNITSINFVAEDTINQKQNATPVTLSISNNFVDVSTVQACGLSTSQYFNTSFQANNYTYINSYSYGFTATSLWGNPVNGSNLIYLYAYTGNNNITTVGNYSANIQLSQRFGNYNYFNSFGYSSTINITEFGAVGQFVAGTVTGNVVDSSSGTTQYPVNCSFRVRRTQ